MRKTRLEPKCGKERKPNGSRGFDFKFLNSVLIPEGCKVLNQKLAAHCCLKLFMVALLERFQNRGGNIGKEESGICLQHWIVSGQNMASPRVGFRLAVCLLNISEARKQDIVERIAEAALRDKPGISIVTACTEAYDLIDIEQHDGIHPCLGSVDLVPIYPLSESVSLEECGEVARDIAERLSHDVPDCSMFYFGYADQPLKRDLVQRRKELNWYKRSNLNVNEIKPDVGMTVSPRYGLTGIGASPYVMNCNVTIDTQDLNIGQQIASAVRGANPGGLRGIQAMAFPHEGTVEIACNVESFKDKPPSSVTEKSTQYISYYIQGEEYLYFSPISIERQIKKLAASHEVPTVGTALVGFTPERCKNLAEQAIREGCGEFWKRHKTITM
ncbi:formiminotransferase N-terminal subdomain-containing protein isoform X2 [Scyliorhinus torazame]|uniref:formiminotransferase N-terminal subdomain-containing protein isoform X2 n=1 Tax=Scyliorhinus torazame TaxID=75743 RepID=UPI003B58BE54